MEIDVQADVKMVASEAAKHILAAAGAAITARGRFSLVLAGGSTPAALYRLLASPQNVGRIDWPKVEVFFGDERCVPQDHEWSNYAMARRTLLDRVSLPSPNVHRIPGELPPTEVAVSYAETIRAALALENVCLPRFDLILLGMGDDGHTASLFPGMPALHVRDEWVVGTQVPNYVRPQVARVTLTLPVLNAGREVLFLVSGQAKAESVRRVLRDAEHDAAAAALPAAQVRPLNGGALRWLLDKPAASFLKGE